MMRYTTIALILLILISLPVNAISGDGLRTQNFTGNRAMPSLAAADAANTSLCQQLESLVDIVNWTESMDTKYVGTIFGKTTLSDLQQGIANLTNWEDVLYWSAVTRKFRIENKTKIEWALDNAVMVSDGSLPESGNDTYGDYFSLHDRYLLYGYYWASQYSYDLSKWDLARAYYNFRVAWINHGSGFLNYYNTSYVFSGSRYYDEEAETMSCFLLFYEFGLDNALADAQKEWTYLNSKYWKDTFYPYHYWYSAIGSNWECEAGGFLEIIAWLKYYVGDLANSENLVADTQNRFLLDRWQSYQWGSFFGSPNYCVIHAYPSNGERRLENTIMAWAAILGVYDLLSASGKQNATDLLLGFDGYDPAWKLLMNSSCDLYDDAQSEFRMQSDANDSNTATSYGAALMFLMGIVPVNATLAVPIEELSFEYVYNILDPDVFNINLTARTVRVSLATNGTLAFQFNTTVYQNFSQNGTYSIQFSPDWSSITGITRVGDLPNNRIYILSTAPKPSSNLPITSIILVIFVSAIFVAFVAVIVYKRKRK